MSMYRENYKRLSDQVRIKWINKSIENSKQYEVSLLLFFSGAEKRFDL